MKIKTGILAVAVGAIVATSAIAQSWPARPIRIIVTAGSGTTIDLAGRVAGGEMGKLLGTTFIVDNRPGAAGFVGARAVATAEPDGHTVLLANLNNLLLVKEPVILGKDLSPIGDYYQQPIAVLVRGNLGVKTFQQLVAHAKANPSKLNYGDSTGNVQLMMDLLRTKSSLSYTLIRYKTGTPITQLLSGEIDLTAGSVGSLTAQVQTGKIIPVLFFSKSEAYPNVPTAVELGLIPVPLIASISFSGPPKLPQEIGRRLSAALSAAMKTPEVIEGLRKIGEPYYTTPDQQLREYKEVSDIFLAAAKAANFVPQE